MGVVKRTHPESVISQKAKLDFMKRLRRLGTTNQRWKAARVMLKLEKWDYKKTDFKRKYPNPSHIQSEMLKSCGISYKHYRKHENMFIAFSEILDDEIINGTSKNIEKPIGLFSEICRTKDD